MTVLPLLLWAGWFKNLLKQGWALLCPPPPAPVLRPPIGSDPSSSRPLPSPPPSTPSAGPPAHDYDDPAASRRTVCPILIPLPVLHGSLRFASLRRRSAVVLHPLVSCVLVRFTSALGFGPWPGPHKAGWMEMPVNPSVASRVFFRSQCLWFLLDLSADLFRAFCSRRKRRCWFRIRSSLRGPSQWKVAVLRDGHWGS
ncbi:hypothetical protein GW17_00026176 [Ensete ventricosum]|nr:hypothetical protein GW17_00026176 [Ensete ventricosum]RZR93640.1 hypothetical protein BHM03_00022180 [Ensete ventricosum]